MLPEFPLNYVTYAPASCEVATSNGLGRDVFTRKYMYIILPLTSRSMSHEMIISTLCIM